MPKNLFYKQNETLNDNKKKNINQNLITNFFRAHSFIHKLDMKDFFFLLLQKKLKTRAFESVILIRMEFLHFFFFGGARYL